MQASEIIADLQKSANKSLDEMVDKIKDLKNPEIQVSFYGDGEPIPHFCIEKDPLYDQFFSFL